MRVTERKRRRTLGRVVRVGRLDEVERRDGVEDGRAEVVVGEAARQAAEDTVDACRLQVRLGERRVRRRARPTAQQRRPQANHALQPGVEFGAGRVRSNAGLSSEQEGVGYGAGRGWHAAGVGMEQGLATVRAAPLLVAIRRAHTRGGAAVVGGPATVRRRCARRWCAALAARAGSARPAAAIVASRTRQKKLRVSDCRKRPCLRP